MKVLPKQNIILLIIIMVIMLVSVLTMIIPQVFGFTITVVNDDYMEPTYNQGTLLLVKKASEDHLVVGDEVTYYTDQGIHKQTRRIVAIEEDQSLLYIIGDKRQKLEQRGIHPSQLIGRPVFAVPFVGYLISPKMILLMKCLYALFASYVFFLTIVLTLSHIKNESIKKTISF